MTARRRDGGGSVFSNWLRKQPEISSDKKRGYVATDIDFIWHNYRTGEWMFLEEKCFLAPVERWQHEMLMILWNVAKHDPKFRGGYVIQFERTSPDDGDIYINKVQVSREQFMLFLQFKWFPPVAE
jgi:hypothetical protein